MEIEEINQLAMWRTFQDNLRPKELKDISFLGDIFPLDTNYGTLTYLKKSEALVAIKSLQSYIEHLEKHNISDKTIELYNKDYLDKMYGDNNYTVQKTNVKKAPEKKGYVYLMRDNNTGFIKIGYSKNPKHREHTLQSEKPTIELLFKSPGNRKLEDKIHEHFSEFRIRGEWFKLDDNQTKKAKQLIKAGL